MMVVILTPVDGIIRWLPRGFSCSPIMLTPATWGLLVWYSLLLADLG